MPLARMALYSKGVGIYLAPTADARERWPSTLQHIALEGRCFVLGCNQYVHRDMYPKDLKTREELETWPETLCRGGSAIYGPLGDVVAGPLWEQEGILVADLDLTASRVVNSTSTSPATMRVQTCSSWRSMSPRTCPCSDMSGEASRGSCGRNTFVPQTS